MRSRILDMCSIGVTSLPWVLLLVVFAVLFVVAERAFSR